MAVKGNVTNRVVLYIKQNIQDGTWPVGSKIPSENDMCRYLDVSRISVRSALKRFIMLGILQSQHGKGTFVLTDDLSALGKGVSQKVEVNEIIQLLQVRLLIEPEICGQAAAIATPELANSLSRLTQQMKDSINDSERFVGYDMQFHQMIVDSLGNQVLSSFMLQLFRHDDSSERLNDAVGYYGGVFFHALLTDAIAAHDVKQARSVMAEHLQSALNDLGMLPAERAPTL